MLDVRHHVLDQDPALVEHRDQGVQLADKLHVVLDHDDAGVPIDLPDQGGGPRHLLARHAGGRLGIGIKNQVQDVFNGLSVFENLYLAASSAHARRQATLRARELAARVGLKQLLEAPVATLAHGQRQWVEIAMVIARQPKLVLLDEPSAGMTIEETRQTADLIREVNRTATIIVVEHDMQFIRQIARKVTVFHQGRILLEDTFERVVADPVVRAVYLGRQTVH